MKRDEIQNIQRLLKNTFDGAAWHGPAVFKVIQDIDFRLAFMEFDNIHSIAELVDHMTSWRIFAIERLKGNTSFEVSQENDWRRFTRKDESHWLEIKDKLLASQEAMLAVLEKTYDSKLSDLVEGKAYDFYTMLHGVIQHDIYHAGQISLLKKR